MGDKRTKFSESREKHKFHLQSPFAWTVCFPNAERATSLSEEGNRANIPDVLDKMQQLIKVIRLS